jgi:hypothetical protein
VCGGGREVVAVFFCCVFPGFGACAGMILFFVRYGARSVSMLTPRMNRGVKWIGWLPGQSLSICECGNPPNESGG